MKVKIIKLPKFREYNILFISDAHIGHRSCRIDLFKDTLKRLKEPNTFAILGGDMIDAILHSDRKRFNPAEIDDINFRIKDLADLPKKQVQFLCGLMNPYKDKILAAVCGNHESVIAKYHSYDPYNDYCERLGLPEDARLGDMGVLRLMFNFNGNSFTNRDFNLLHGPKGGGGYKEGRIKNSMMEVFKYTQFNVNLMAHMHFMEAEPFDFTTLSVQGKFHKKWQFYGVSGCYLEAVQDNKSTYGDTIKGPRPHIGYLEYKIKRDGKHEIHDQLDKHRYLV